MFIVSTDGEALNCRHLFRRFYFEFYREAVPLMQTPGKRHYYSCDIYIILKIIESKCNSPNATRSELLIAFQNII